MQSMLFSENPPYLTTLLWEQLALLKVLFERIVVICMRLHRSYSLFTLVCMVLGSTSFAETPLLSIKELPKHQSECTRIANRQIEVTTDPDFLVEVYTTLSPILQGSKSPEEVKKPLAQLLQCEEKFLPKEINEETLNTLEKRIAQAVYLKQLKLLATHYDYDAMERSIEHLKQNYGSKYPQGNQFLKILNNLKSKYPNPNEWITQAKIQDIPELEKLVNFRKNAIITSNPGIDFDSWISIRRFSDKGKASRRQDRPANWQGLTSLSGAGRQYHSQIIKFPNIKSSKSPDIIKSHDKWMGMLTMDFDGKTVMVTSNHISEAKGRKSWDVYEISLKGDQIKNLSSHMPDDTDSYDSCYLPDGRLLFMNTSGMQGVPCVTGSDYVGNMHIMNKDGSAVRRITADQDNNWSPTLLHNGRIMFLRWEYTESAHYFSRILMHMNPDGTDQKEFYGSNSYWPNSLFDAKPIPNKPGQFIGVVSGHHGQNRVGELVKFDVNLGRKGTEGAVQKIPGFGKKVEDITKDQLVDNIKTPYFAEPYPINDTYYLSASSITPDRQNMNIVFCDAFDNIIPITASDYYIYAEPNPVKTKTKPPIIPDRVKLDSPTSIAYISNVYIGKPMEGVPHGEAKSLRVFTSEYSPRNTGSHYAMGMESNWDLKVLYGTVPINEDGSAIFEIPANAPVTLQVLDKEGKAIALMRSWFTAMPGEMLSCIGCHENQNMTPPVKRTMASRQAPKKIEPFQGPVRTLSFMNEIQPILDKNCISCHNKESNYAKSSGDKRFPDFNDRSHPQGAPAPGSKSYWALHPYVRRNGPEGNYLGLHPGEFSADTSELVQLLKKGHYNVKLSDADWRSLYTWIDMNVPYLGEWPGQHNEKVLKRRQELNNQYFPYKMDYVLMNDAKYKEPQSIPPTPQIRSMVKPSKINVGEDKGAITTMNLDLGNGKTIKLNQIPCKKPFYIGQTEVTLEQYRQFDPTYQNGYYDMHYKDQVNPGYNMDANPQYPVIRVPWTKAMEFCAWLSQKTGKKVSLPTEEQWEIAARGGKTTPFYFGNIGDDFSTYANLADQTIKELAVMGVDPKPIKNPNRFFDFVPRDEHFNDKVLHLAPVAQYQPNQYGLYDMVGNVAEWTKTKFSLQSDKADHSIKPNLNNEKLQERTVKGGSWRDRPAQATISSKWGYPAWRPVYNVGFRIIIED